MKSQEHVRVKLFQAPSHTDREVEAEHREEKNFLQMVKDREQNRFAQVENVTCDQKDPAESILNLNDKREAVEQNVGR